MGDLNAIFKAYDVRGIYPDQFDEDAAYAIGGAFASFTGASEVLVGHDMRTSAESLVGAFLRGVTEAGVDAIDVGLCSTDLIYFASGVRQLPGAMFTASHNPPQYNGIKFCKSGAAPVGQDTGLGAIKALASQWGRPEGVKPGTVHREDMLDAFADHLLAMIDVASIRPLVVAVDAANGMGGKVVPAVFDKLPIEVVPLFFELDGTFPNHPADPIQPENLKDLQRAVLERKADIGLAFDGDADRVFLVDENAEPVSGSLTTALVADRILKEHRGAAVVHNVICSRVVPEVIAENDGVAVRSRVGHSFVKQLMAERSAVFGGEHSGHYYFKENFNADSGLAAALYVLEAMSAEGKPLSELLAPLRRYEASGEINVEVADQQGVMNKIEAAYADGSSDKLDGLTVNYPEWWFNVRPSNTEPLLRLNVEARASAKMEAERDRIVALMKGN